MHDGQVTAVAMAHDDSCLISAASDGTLMLLSNPLAPGNHTAAAADLADRKLPTMSQDAAGQAEIADSTASSLTLEEAKQAAQRNMQAAAAAAAREQLVAAMEAMRKEYAALVAANNARGPGERVPQHMLEVDAGVLLHRQPVSQYMKQQLTPSTVVYTSDTAASSKYPTQLDRIKVTMLHVI